MRWRIAVAAALVLVPRPAHAQHHPPADTPFRNPTAAEWREDLATLAERLRMLHPEPFLFTSAVAFDAAVADLDARIPTLERHEILVGMARILALVRDGHTRLQLASDMPAFAVDPAVGFRRLPLRLYHFDDGLVVEAADAAHRDLVGGRLLRIGSADSARAFAAAGEIAMADNDQGVRHQVAMLLAVPEVLDALGLVEEMEAVPVTVEIDGREVTRVLHPVPSGTTIGWQALGAGVPIPLYRRHPDRPYWFEAVPDQDLVYVQYNLVQNAPGQSIAELFERAFAAAREMNAARLVIDVRQNPGGNNVLNWPIVYGLIRADSLNVEGRLFTIIGRATFSAAQNGVNELEKHTRTLLVGEPTGARPNSYGDPLRSTLPHSGISVWISTLFWQNEPLDDRPWTPPDLFTPMRSADAAAGRDTALEAILAYQPDELLAELEARLTAGDLTGAATAYRTAHENELHRYADREALLNALGYRLLGAGKVDAAVALFRLNIEAYPASANAHDSLGEALWRSGVPAAAIAAYERAVTLDPEGFVGENARTMLARIRAGAPPP